MMTYPNNGNAPRLIWADIHRTLKANHQGNPRAIYYDHETDQFINVNQYGVSYRAFEKEPERYELLGIFNRKIKVEDLVELLDDWTAC